MTSLLQKIPLNGIGFLFFAALFGACSASGDGANESSELSGSAGPDLIGGDGDAKPPSDAAGDGDGTPLVLGPVHEGGAGGALNSASCLPFMSWGITTSGGGSFVGRVGQSSIVSWLNEYSTATGEHFEVKPEETAELLASVDLLLLGDLAGWTFTESEKNALERWVLAGGSVFALSGYGADEGLKVTNDLLSFAEVRFLSAGEGGETSISLAECGYCLGLTDKQEGFISDHPISKEVSSVGAYFGRSIEGEGQIVAQEMGDVLALTKEKGEGRLFFFHDDWISYRDKWRMGTPAECMAQDACVDVSPSGTYQIAQLWYNAFRWLAPHHACFDVDDEDIVH